MSYLAGIHSKLLKQLDQEEPVTEEDVTLINAFNKGDDTAGYKLFVKHHKMILKVVLDITRGRWFDDDCFHAGTVGLYEAAKRFDPSRGFKFLTYAVPWIRKYVYLEACSDVLPAGGISFSRDFRDRLYRYIGFKMTGMSDEDIKIEMNINDKILDSLSVAARSTSRPAQLSVPSSSIYSDNGDEEIPTPGLPTSPSAEEEAISNSSVSRFMDIINSIHDPQTKFILQNRLFYYIDDLSMFKDVQIVTDKKEQMKILGVTTLSQYNSLKRKAYRTLRKALRASERKEKGDL